MKTGVKKHRFAAGEFEGYQEVTMRNKPLPTRHAHRRGSLSPWAILQKSPSLILTRHHTGHRPPSVTDRRCRETDIRSPTLKPQALASKTGGRTKLCPCLTGRGPGTRKPGRAGLRRVAGEEGPSARGPQPARNVASPAGSAECPTISIATTRTTYPGTPWYCIK